MAQCSQHLIATPTVTVNNIAFAVVSDSVEVTVGFGEREVMGASVGGNSICQITSEDVTKAVGIIKFSVYSTKDNISILLRFMESSQISKLTSEVTGTDNISGDTLTFSMSGGTIVNNPAIKFGPSGQVEIEIHGRKLAA